MCFCLYCRLRAKREHTHLCVYVHVIQPALLEEVGQTKYSLHTRTQQNDIMADIMADPTAPSDTFTSHSHTQPQRSETYRLFL